MAGDLLIVATSILVPPAMGLAIYRWRLSRREQMARKPLERMYDDVDQELEGSSRGSRSDSSPKQ